MADKKNYLDKTGLSHLWSKIKDYISGATVSKSKGLVPVAKVGSNAASSSGWYKVADSTMRSYGNTNITFLIKEGYMKSHVGILELEMRSDNTSVACWMCKWLVRSGIPSNNIRIVINGMKWTLYYKVNSGQYGCTYFIELQHRNLNGEDPTYTVNYYNTTTKESTEPTATVTSSDGGTVNYANSAGSATKASQDINGVAINTGYLRQYGDYLNTHPENSGTILPFMNNDIAFLTERGGTVKVYYDGVEQTISTANMFDSSSSYWTNNPTGITEVVIELTLHKVFTWTNTIYVDHGSSGWRAKNVKIETINSNYADDVWVARYTNTAQSKGNYFTTFGHTVVGQSNASGGFNKVRLTFSGWANATIFRIAQIGIINYGSLGLRENYMSRGIDDGVLRHITPYYNGKYNFGSATKRWLSGHFLKLVLYGSAADQPLMTRGIVGSDGNGAAGELHLQYGVNQPIKLGNAAAYSISADGGTYSGTAAKATSATKAQYDKNGDDIASTYLKKAGDTFTGPIKWGGATALPASSNLLYILGIDAFADGGQTKYIRIEDMKITKDKNGNDIVATYVKKSGDTMTGELDISGIPGNGGQIRIYNGSGSSSYGTILRNDGNITYILLTNAGDQLGSWNNLRPLQITNSTGKVTMQNGLAVSNGLTTNNESITSDADSTSASTGSLVSKGGIGIAKAINGGTTITAAKALKSTEGTVDLADSAAQMKYNSTDKCIDFIFS